MPPQLSWGGTPNVVFHVVPLMLTLWAAIWSCSVCPMTPKSTVRKKSFGREVSPSMTAVGAATAVVMGSIVNAATNKTYNSYRVSQGSPGAQLLMNYQLQQVQCGPPNLVVIYGPNNGVICAMPNNLVAPGTYAVNMDNLTLQSP